jgi:hypothetical protein
VLTLLAPVFLLLALVMLGDWRQASAAKVPAGDGTINLAFIGNLVQVDAENAPILSPPPLPFQHLFLNIIGIRLNPSTDASVAEGDKNWVTIAAPVLPGIGNKTGTPQISIDITQIGQLAQFFTNANIKAKQYNQIELLLNSVNPGTIVPLCNALPSPGEGCTAYPIGFPAGSGGSSIRTTFDFDLAKKAVLPLVISITVDVPAEPSVTGSQVTVQVPTITAVPNSDDTQPLNPYLALITGKVTGGNGATTVINAEPTGTSDLVSPINPFNILSGGNFAFYIPALPAGTAYDFYATANDRDFALQHDITVLPDTNNSLATFPLKTHSRSAVKGSLVDACNGGIPAALQNATLEILEQVPSPSSTPTPAAVHAILPDAATPTPSPTPNCDLNPCVAVATAVTDLGGSFPTPVPGNGNGTAAFLQIPQGFDYVLVVNAPGFDRTVVPIIHKNGILECTGTHDTTDKSICDLALSHGYLDGSVVLSTAAANPVTAQVVAEDSNSTNLENTITLTIPAGQTTASFSGNSAMFIPDQLDSRFGTSLTTLDLYALIVSDFNGASQANTGYSIPVEAALPVPSACATETAGPLANVTCVGHGSIDGSLADVTAGTTAVLEKPDPNDLSDLVQLISGPAGPYGADDTSGYALCAPAGDYVLQRFDNGTPGTQTPVALASPSQPTANATPCPAICDAGQGTSCLVCTNTAGPSL